MTLAEPYALRSVAEEASNFGLSAGLPIASFGIAFW